MFHSFAFNSWLFQLTGKFVRVGLIETLSDNQDYMDPKNVGKFVLC
jgi:hypothetical protein